MEKILEMSREIREIVNKYNKRMIELHERLESDISVEEEIMIAVELMDIMEKAKPMVALLSATSNILVNEIMLNKLSKK